MSKWLYNSLVIFLIALNAFFLLTERDAPAWAILMRVALMLFWLWILYRHNFPAPPTVAHDWVLVEWASGTEVYKCHDCGIIKKERASLWDRMED